MAAKTQQTTEEKPKTGFLRVRAHESGDEFIVFGRASTEIKDPKTGEVLVTPRGGKAAVKAEIIEML